MNKENKDIKLLRKIRKQEAGSERAFYELYHKYSAKLNAFCIFRTNRKEIAEEVFQETWMRFYKIIIRGKEIKNVQQYLLTIARNLIIDSYHNSKNTTYVEEESFDIESFANPAVFIDDMGNNELFALMMTAVNNLDEIYKEAFILKKLNGLSYKEIAIVCGETVECIKKRVVRATFTIKETLKPYINEL